MLIYSRIPLFATVKFYFVVVENCWNNFISNIKELVGSYIYYKLIRFTSVILHDSQDFKKVLKFGISPYTLG